MPIQVIISIKLYNYALKQVGSDIMQICCALGLLLLSWAACFPSADSLKVNGSNKLSPITLRETIPVSRAILPVTLAGAFGILSTTSSSAAKAASQQFEYQPALQGLDYGKPRTSYPDFTQMVNQIHALLSLTFKNVVFLHIQSVLLTFIYLLFYFFNFPMLT